LFLIIIKYNNIQVLYQKYLDTYTSLLYTVLVGFEEKQVQYSIFQIQLKR
jgi:hypothetical protein